MESSTIGRQQLILAFLPCCRKNANILIIYVCNFVYCCLAGLNADKKNMRLGYKAAVLARHDVQGVKVQMLE